MQDGTIVERVAGTPQGGVISPVLANLFMHYAFDDFMSKQFPYIQWIRYADDGALNCVSLKQAKYIIDVLGKRFKTFGLELNLEKTKIVYCKDEHRTGNYENIKFDFLGYTFRMRGAKGKYGEIFNSFLPSMSDKARRAIREELRSWRIQLRVNKSLKDIANMLNSKIQGWINYYSHYYKAGIVKLLEYINLILIKWVKRKYKNIRTIKKANNWLAKIAKRDTKLFAHWKYGVLPMAR